MKVKLFFKKIIFKKIYLVIKIYLSNSLVSSFLDINSKFFSFFYNLTKPLNINNNFKFFNESLFLNGQINKRKFLLRNLFTCFVFFQKRLEFFFFHKKKCFCLILL